MIVTKQMHTQWSRILRILNHKELFNYLFSRRVPHIFKTAMSEAIEVI